MTIENEDLQQSNNNTDTDQQARHFREKTELHLSLIKDEIASQANTFDQIDSKTGVALGFTFVVIGQVLAAVFRIATDQSHLQGSHPEVATAAFVLASGLAWEVSMHEFVRMAERA